MAHTPIRILPVLLATTLALAGLTCDYTRIDPSEKPLVKASFAVNNNPCEVPCNLNLINNSVGATEFFWDFGNGITSTAQLPTNIVYDQTGEYTVRLRVTGDFIAKETTIKITVVPTGSLQPTANFQVRYDSCSNIKKITLINLSQKAETYFWDFGDQTTSTEQNPTHVYTNPGKYKVILTAKNLYGQKDTSTIVTILQEEKFVVTINKGYIEEANSIAVMKSGKYLVTGSRIVKDSMKQLLFYVLDANGQNQKPILPVTDGRYAEGIAGFPDHNGNIFTVVNLGNLIDGEVYLDPSFSFFDSSSLSPSKNIPTNSTFNRYYLTEARAAIQSSDRSFLSAGFTRSKSINNCKPYAAQISFNNSITQRRPYLEETNVNAKFFDLVENYREQEYAFCGAVNNKIIFATTPFLQPLSEKNLTKYFSIGIESTDSVAAHSMTTVVKDSKILYALCGYQKKNGKSEGLVLLLNKMGEKVMPPKVFSDVSRFTSIIEFCNDGLLVGGQDENGKPILVKLDQFFGENGRRSYDSIGQINAISLTPDGGLIATGTIGIGNSRRVFVVKTNKNLDL